MNNFKFLIVALILVISQVYADVYMHNPRGSNNKLNEEQRATQNQNRLFDSQNNANGGYNWGPSMTYYAGSLLQIEWTAQHGCGSGNPNTDCNMVIQYMCGPWIRDGTTTDTIPQTLPTSLQERLKYGQHEPTGFYDDCTTRSRDYGIFIADRVQRGNLQTTNNDATRTRQNNNGNRHGYECPEERDHYPYWHPTPWKDVAILTSNVGRCPYYQANSQNVVEKGHCIDKDTIPASYDISITETIPNIWGNSTTDNSFISCEKSGHKWLTVPSWGLPAPDCLSAVLTRDNHLGNSDFGTTSARYLWIIPQTPSDDPSDTEIVQSTCVIRLRYNISSEDYKSWEHIDTGDSSKMIDQRFNDENSPVRQDPEVNFGTDSKNMLRNLSLAIDTTQFGRTFEDRSHSFFLRPRPSNVPAAARIFNLNVRGKRGNIVQAYPAVEYDFTPNNLKVTTEDFVHVQWTGSDHNPAGNAGEGTDKTDRSNLVQLAQNGDARRNYPVKFSEQTMFPAQTAYRFAHVDQPDVCNSSTETGCCLSYEQLREKNGNNQNNIDQDTQNCAKLNAASAYFDGGAVQITNPGVYNYMSTRNNNFTNRSQKGTVEVSSRLPPVPLTAVVVGSASFAGAGVIAGGVYLAKMNADSAAANIFNGIKI